MEPVKYLKANTEAELKAGLPFAFSGSEFVPYGQGYGIDLIGTMMTTGSYDEEGNELVAPAPIAGYHANIVGTAEILAQVDPSIIIPDPANPRRKFQGQP